MSGTGSSRGFCSCLTAEQFDYRLAGTLASRAGAPRENQVRILYGQRVYLNGMRSGMVKD